MANEFKLDVETSHLIADRIDEVVDSIVSSSEKIPAEPMEDRGGDVEHILLGVTGDILQACIVLKDHAQRGADAVRRIADDASYVESEFEAEFDLLWRGLCS